MLAVAAAMVFSVGGVFVVAAAVSASPAVVNVGSFGGSNSCVVLRNPAEVDGAAASANA